MFEAMLLNGNILKKILEAIKDVVNDVNIDASSSGKFLTDNSFENRRFSSGYGWKSCCSCEP
jgi:hypothetical protein